MENSSYGRSSPATAAAEGAGGLVNAADAVPFMLHVLLVLWISWLLLPVNLKGFFLLCFFIVYLFQVERRARDIERCGIAFTERKNINRRRIFDEGESSRWLNEGIKSMWPLGMEMFASKHFFGPMAPFFLDKYKPSWIVKEAKMDISSLYLGSMSPVFNDIRALEQSPEGDHVAYEATMEFHSGDDMYAEMSVQTGVGKITFYISRLRIEGKVKISVKFLEGWPVVGRVRLCFASRPRVTMSYKLYNKDFLDMSLIPGVAASVDEMLHKAMEDSIVQPNMLQVDIESLASLLFPDSRPQQDATENKFTLLVEILEATDLTVADRNGSSDPFVAIHFGCRKKKTKVIRKTLHPKWRDEKHEFCIENWELPNLVTLHVQDWDRVRYRNPYNLGMWTVDLRKLYLDEKKCEFGKRYVSFESLDGVSTGCLRFAITVNHTQFCSTSEGPSTSDGGLETVTQEIKTDDVIYNPPSKVEATTQLKRSMSDTNLDMVRSTPAVAVAALKRNAKTKRNMSSRQLNPTGLYYSSNPSKEALKGQILIDESHDIIHMPYGPPGAFTIFHPGSLVQGGPSREEPTNNPSPKSAAAAASDAEAQGKVPSSWLRNTLRGREKKKKISGTSQENSLPDTMSEQSERWSIDMTSSDVLRNLDPSEKLHGLDGMDRSNHTPDDDAAPEEPPDMYTPKSLPPSVHSGKAALTVLAGSSHAESDHAAAAHHASFEPPQHVQRNGSAFSGGIPFPSAWRTAEDRGERDDDDDGESDPDDLVVHANSSSSSLQPPQRQSTGKSMIPRVPKKWYKKMWPLAAKEGKKKMTTSVHGAAANGVAYSSELKDPNAEVGEADLDYHADKLDEHEDGATPSRTESFINEYSSPFDANNPLTNNGGTPVGSIARRASAAPQPHEPHEQRNLMQETPLSRAAGSQSDRSNWASVMKKLIRRQSKSLRFESGSLLSRSKQPRTPPFTDASLNRIA